MPASRSSMIRLWMYSMEPTSTPRVGCEAISTFSGRDSSRATTTFCWLPPDRDDDRRRRALGADVELLDALLGVRLDGAHLQRRAGGELGRMVHVEDEVLAHRERADEAVVAAVLGDVPDPGGQAGARAGLAEVVAVELELPASGVIRPIERLDRARSGRCPARRRCRAPRRRGPRRSTPLTTWCAARVEDRHVAGLEHDVADLGLGLVDGRA